MALEQQLSITRIPARELADFHRKIASQPVLEQARGIVMGHYGVGADEALRIISDLTPAGMATASVAELIAREFPASTDPDLDPGNVVKRWRNSSLS